MHTSMIARIVLVTLLIAFASCESCVCMAYDYGFDIDCSQTTLMEENLAYLEDNDCATTCTTVGCERAYYFIQTHHDYCPDVPTDVADGVHDYEAVCADCDIDKYYNSSLPQCPSVNCTDDTEAVSAYNVLTNSTNACSTSCTSTTCGDAFQIVRAFHDSCSGSAIDETIELAVHDYEDICWSQDCNVSTGPVDLTCADYSSASTVTIGALALLAVAVL